MAELAGALVHDLTWTGVGRFVALFTVIWLSFVGFTLYANRFDTDDILYRFAKLTGMLAITGCAASASEATGSLVVAFSASYLLGRTVLVALYARAWWHVREARPTIAVYLFTATCTAALWAVSIAVPSPWRYLLWAFAALVDALAPVVATKARQSVPLHMEHLPERFGLLVILVLGEVVAAIVTGVHDTKWTDSSVALGALGFVLAATLWWCYFDVGASVAAASLRAADEADNERDPAPTEGADPHTDERHDLFIYGHLPVTAGVAAAGVGIEDLLLHPNGALPSAGSWLVCAGVATFLLGLAVIVAGTRRSWRGLWLWPGAAIPLSLGWGWLTPSRPWVALSALLLLLVVTAAIGSVLAQRTVTSPDRDALSQPS